MEASINLEEFWLKSIGPTLYGKIIDNYTPRGGAGIYCKQSTTPVQPEIRNCIFDTNIAGTGGGGGIRGKSTANPSVFDSYFVENSADFGGAISHPFGGNPIVINNTVKNFFI